MLSKDAILALKAKILIFPHFIILKNGDFEPSLLNRFKPLRF